MDLYTYLSLVIPNSRVVLPKEVLELRDKKSGLFFVLVQRINTVEILQITNDMTFEMSASPYASNSLQFLYVDLKEVPALAGKAMNCAPNWRPILGKSK